MASDSDARMPGPSTARAPAITTLAAMATPRLGARANTSRAADTTKATSDRNRSTRLGVLGHQPGGDAGADDEPDQLGRLDAGGHEPACPLVEVELLLVDEGGERDEPDQRGAEERQAVPDPPQGLDLPDHPPGLGERGGASSVATTSALAPMAARSWPPRTGSLSQKASTTKTPSGRRRPGTAPASRTRRRAARRGAARRTPPRRWRPGGPRTPGPGPTAGSSRPAASCGWGRRWPARCRSRRGRRTGRSPRPASPVSSEKRPQMAPPAAAMGTRGYLSAAEAMGIWSTRASRVTKAMRVRMPWVPRPNSSRISGSRMPKAVRSSSSTVLSPNSTTRGRIGPPEVIRLSQPRGPAAGAATAALTSARPRGSRPGAGRGRRRAGRPAWPARSRRRARRRR